MVLSFSFSRYVGQLIVIFIKTGTPESTIIENKSQACKNMFIMLLMGMLSASIVQLYEAIHCTVYNVQYLFSVSEVLWKFAVLLFGVCSCNLHSPFA